VQINLCRIQTADSDMSIQEPPNEATRSGLLSCIPEYAHLPAASDGTTMGVVANFKCPSLEQQQGGRLPVRLCAVIDTSGSMAGFKLQLVKAVTTFMTQQLTKHDSFALISYDTQVRTNCHESHPLSSSCFVVQVTEVMPLTVMTERKKGFAECVINSMSPGGGTNMSGGLTKGLNVLQASPTKQCSEPAGQ
jgi:hypothetical protein